MTKNDNLVSWLVDIIEFQKVVIVWLHRKGEGELKDTHCNTQNTALKVGYSKIPFRLSEWVEKRAVEELHT